MLKSYILIILALLVILCGSCASGFRKQRYTNFRSKAPEYGFVDQDRSKSSDSVLSVVDTVSVNDVTGTDRISKNPKQKQKEPFRVRRIDRILAYTNMLIGCVSAYLVIGILPIIRGGFSMDRIIDKTYTRRDRRDSIIAATLSVLGALLLLALVAL